MPKLFSKFLLCVFLLGNSAAVAMHQEGEVAQPVLSHILAGRWAYTFCYYQGENKLLRKEVPTQAMNIDQEGLLQHCMAEFEGFIGESPVASTLFQSLNPGQRGLFQEGSRRFAQFLSQKEVGLDQKEVAYEQGNGVHGVDGEGVMGPAPSSWGVYSTGYTPQDDLRPRVFFYQSGGHEEGFTCSFTHTPDDQ